MTKIILVMISVFITSSVFANCKLEARSYETNFEDGSYVRSAFVNSTLTREIKSPDLIHCQAEALFECRWQRFEGVSKKGKKAVSLEFKRVKISFAYEGGETTSQVTCASH